MIKRSFLLLELLIGLFLLTLCVFPLTHLPGQAVSQATKKAWQIELGRLADLQLAEIKEKIYTQALTWKKIQSTAQQSLTLEESSLTAFVPSLGTKKFTQKTEISSKGKKDKEGHEYYLLSCTFTFQPHAKQGLPSKETAFLYKLYVSSRRK